MVILFAAGRRIIDDKKNTAAPAVSVFSVIEFSPQGLTTKNDALINNFWQFPVFFLQFCRGLLVVSIIHFASVF